MLKKVVATAASFCLVLVLAACSSGDGGKGSTQTANQQSQAATTVKVLDEMRESVNGYSVDSNWISTHYQYNDAGQVVSSSQDSNIAKSDALNLSKAAYEYDELGNLTMISTAYEQFGWNVGNKTTFGYDTQGRCTSCRFEIVSQGDGAQQCDYTMASKSQVASAKVHLFKGAAETESFDASWKYMDNGMLDKMTSNSPMFPSVEYVADLSNAPAGTFMYRHGNGTTTKLTFDADGNLTSAVDQSGTQVISKRTYTYKSIQVTSGFRPSVVSNPTGFDFLVQPAVAS